MSKKRKIIILLIIIVLAFGIYLYFNNPSFVYSSENLCSTGTNGPIPVRIAFYNIGIVIGEEKMTFLSYKEYKNVLNKYKELKKKLKNYKEDYGEYKCLGGYYIIAGKKYSSHILEDSDIESLITYITVFSNQRS